MRKTARLLLIAILLFVFFQADYYWRKPIQAYIAKQFSQGFDKNVAFDWYRSHFQGFPAVIPTFPDRQQQESVSVGLAPKNYIWPVTGPIIRNFNLPSPGIMLRPTANSSVKSIAEGKVIFAGSSRVRGYIVVVQHTGMTESVYGGLSSVDVSKDEYVSMGQIIGTAGDPSMYFSVIVNGQPVHPNDVIHID